MEEYEEEPKGIFIISGSGQKNVNSRTEPKLTNEKQLCHSNSANDLLDIKEARKKKRSERSRKQKYPFYQRNSSAKCFDHYDRKNCEHCQGINKLLKKDKSKLSIFIENNCPFLKLFGNPRYNKSSPLLFVEDHKKNIDDERIGLLPIPSKPTLIMKTKDENNRLYEMQRKIVMMRRFQYGQKFSDEVLLKNEGEEDFFVKISKIQFWWKQIYKIIFIQKILRGFRIRKRVVFILNFIAIIKRWQKILDNIKARRFLRKLFNYKIKPIPSNNNRAKNNDNNNKQKIPINNNTRRKSRSIKDESKKNDNDKNIKNDNRNKNRIISKENISSNSSLTKEYYAKNDAINKINKISNSFKEHLKYKKDIIKKKPSGEYDEENNTKESGLYIDKVYIQNYNYAEQLDNNKNKDEEKMSSLTLENEDKNKISKNIEGDNDDDEFKTTINSNDFFFKNKSCYIEKIRINKPSKDTKTINGKDADEKDKNKYNFPKNIGEYGTNPRNKNRKNNSEENVDKNKTPIKEEEDYLKKKHIDSEDNNNQEQDNYNSNKSIDNQNDLYNMSLEVSKPEKFEILKAIELSESKKSKDENKDENVVEDEINEVPIPISGENLYLHENKNFFISKEYKTPSKNYGTETKKENNIILIIEKNYDICYPKEEEENLGLDTLNKKKILKIENIPFIIYEGNKTKRSFDKDKFNINKGQDFVYKGEKKEEGEKEEETGRIEQKMQKNKFSDLNIEKIKSIIEYDGMSRDNNNNLTIESSLNINYLGSIGGDKTNTKDLIIVSNPEISYQGNNIVFDRKNLKIESGKDMNWNIESGKSKKELEKIDFFMQKPINVNYYSSKEISKLNKNIINKEKIKFKAAISGLFMSKLIIKNNLEQIKKIQEYIKNYLLNNKNKKNDKIYKKPLFNQFYYYEDEIPLVINKKNKIRSDSKEGNNNKNENENNDDNNDIDKKKKKINLTLVKDNNNDNESNEIPKKNNRYENEGGDQDEIKNYTKNQIKQYKENNIYDDNYEDEEDAILIKRVIPKRRTSEIYRIKHNHLLKIIKVQKGQSIVEKLIRGGKVVQKIKKKYSTENEEEEGIIGKNKSKTPKNIILHKNFDVNNDDDDKIIKNKKNDENNKDENIRNNHLWKSQLNEEYLGEEEDDINNNDKNNGYLTEYDEVDDDIIKNKKIKKFIINIGNYFYMSKIRIGKFDEDPVKQIQKQFRIFSQKNNNNKSIEDDNNDKNKIIPYIIKNNSYCDKIKIGNKTYKNYIKLNNDLDDKDKIYIIPNNWKVFDEESDKMRKEPKINYITKIRIPFNIKEYKKDNKYSKTTIKELPKISLCYITKENAKKAKNKVIKEKKPISLSLSPKKSIKINFCFITKERRPKLIKEEKYITSEGNNNNIIILPKKEVNYIEKTMKKEAVNQIKVMQNISKSKINEDENKNNDKFFFNNKEKNACISRFNLYFKNKDNYNLEEDDNEKDFCDLNGYISKVYKRYVYKCPLKDICYFSKQLLIKTNKNEVHKNFSFLCIMDFFIKKNVQEYIYLKLFKKKLKPKNNIINTNSDNDNDNSYSNYNYDSNMNQIDDNINEQEDIFTYPKYYKTLKRIYNFYKTKKRGEAAQSKNIYDEIMPEIKKTKSFNAFITKFNDSPNKNKKLIDNISKSDKININEKDYINEIGEFVKFDKNLSNGAFIKNKLIENKTLQKTKNLCYIIKKVDDEYNNLINGKYCYKCGKEKTKCQCENIDVIFNDTNETHKCKEDEEDEDFDMGVESDNMSTNKTINFFEYDSNKSRGILVTNKPKLNTSITQPKKNLIIYNKKQLNEVNKKISGLDKQNTKKYLNSSLNIKESQMSQSNSINYTTMFNNRYNNNYTSNNSFNNNNINYNNIDSGNLKNKSNKNSINYLKYNKIQNYNVYKSSNNNNNY